MSMVRWDPLREIGDLQRSINGLFEGRAGAEGRVLGFPVDVFETPSEVVVRADLPGVRAEDISVRHHDGQIYIRVTRAPQAPEGAAWLVHQTPEGDLARAFALGIPVELDDLQATYDAGVLELRLPKAEHARPREIPVRAGASSRVGRRRVEPGREESAAGGGEG